MLRFEGVTVVPDRRFRWQFSRVEDGEPVAVLTSDSSRVGPGTESRAVRILKALMTSEERQAFDEGGPIEEGDLVGRTLADDVVLPVHAYE